MALVRCSCVVDLREAEDRTGAPGPLEVRVVVLDPGCAYAVHRAAAAPVLLGED